MIEAIKKSQPGRPVSYLNSRTLEEVKKLYEEGIDVGLISQCKDGKIEVGQW